jgi:hypothetical protein
MLNLNELEDIELFIKRKCSLFPDLQKSIVKPDPVRFSIATEFIIMVNRYAFSLSFCIAMHTRATPGVYTLDRSLRFFTGTLL